ncbi:MATE family efflux transporter [Acetivibrio cellulolyticus]|uniref:MATE family efflux transporter n=1 Tax=Acetivibrio cellulolyticus TaxID=35830 RepID=UPI0001E2FAEE|nr:MATE family efflux transporter [Acetivibrio cellulolyticus]
MHTARKYELDMCNGPLLSKIVLFSIPLILTGILQLLYNAVNIVVVGRFVGSSALAAVGSTTALINLIINLFIGLSVGASVVMAKYYGAGQQKDANETVHTAIAISTISGVILTIFGVLMAKPLLQLMGTPNDVLEHAALYMRVYFLGMPASMVFNFSSAILRAVGDTRRPLYFLSVSGVVNVALNLMFVIVFHMDIAGVATATVISQYISVILVLICLIRSDGCIKLRWQDIRFYKDKLFAIIRIGLPAGMQGTIFAISNVLIQSSVNSFGSQVIAGNTAAMNIEGFVYISMNALYHAALSFTGQNIGAKKYNRIGRILGVCLISVTTVGLVLGGLCQIFSNNLLGLYTADQNIIAIGITRLRYVCVLYFICGIMDVLVGSLRGMGYSVLPMLASIVGVCGIRITWIYTVFAAKPTLQTLYISYPISWAITALVHFICFVLIRRKFVSNQTECI